MMHRSRRARWPRLIVAAAVVVALGVALWSFASLGGGERATAGEGPAQPPARGSGSTPEAESSAEPTPPPKRRSLLAPSLDLPEPERESRKPAAVELSQSEDSAGAPGLEREPEPGPAFAAPSVAPGREGEADPSERKEARSAASGEGGTDGGVSGDPLRRALAGAERRLEAGDLVGARALLNDALRDSATPEAEREAIRVRLGRINDDLVFGPTIHPDEPLTESYEVQPGDALSKIASRQGLATDWRLIQRVNRISNPSRIRVGQTLKLVRGPFHAIVDKSDYRLDLYAGPPSDESQWIFMKSFPVGLGEGDSTPTGEFVVREDSKLVNPYWVNPRTGEKFDQDDPDNPIGERWIGLEGAGEYSVLEGYGLHGTIEPESIGGQRSMGCVRLLSDDIALVYECLVEEVSRVKIVP